MVVLGGAAGTFGWLIMLLGGMLLTAFFYLDTKTSKFSILMTLAVGVLAFFSCRFLPMRTGSVTSNYMVFTLFIDAVLFGLVNLLNFWRPRVRILVWWGRNPLILYGVVIIILGLQKAWGPPAGTGLFVASIFTLGTVALATAIAYFLYKKGAILKL